LRSTTRRSGANHIRSGTLAAMNGRRCGPFLGPSSNVATKLTPRSLLIPRCAPVALFPFRAAGDRDDAII
jgi:hypothetical protein